MYRVLFVDSPSQSVRHDNNPASNWGRPSFRNVSRPVGCVADVDVFVDEVLAELAATAKDGVRPMRWGPKPPLAGAALRKAVMAIWCVCFCGMQSRAIVLLCDISLAPGPRYGNRRPIRSGQTAACWSSAAKGRHGDLVCLFLRHAVASDRSAVRDPLCTLYGLFARWTRLGLWRRLLDWLRRDWRRACGDSPEPSALVIDSRSCSSAPSCFYRGVDGERRSGASKAVDEYGIPLAIDV